MSSTDTIGGIVRTGHRSIYKSHSIESSSSSTSESTVSYVKIQELGQGSYGSAVLFRNTADNCLVVWKEIALKNHKISDIQTEVEILSILHHPNIIGYYSHFISNNRVYIEMEYANEGTLNNFMIQQNNKLPEATVIWFFFQLIYGLKYLHNQNIIHRDIKPQNLFLKTNQLLKIGDFGISKQLTTEQEWAETEIGSPMYMAPEIFKGLHYSSKSDIWSCGCVLYELLSMGAHLFRASNKLGLVMKITDLDFQPFPRRGEKYSDALLDLLTSLLAGDPNERPSAAQLFIQCAILSDVEEEFIAKIENLHQKNKICRPSSGDYKEREVISLDSEVFVWGGGKLIPMKHDLFCQKKSGLKVSAGPEHFAVMTVEGMLYTWSTSQPGSKSGVAGQLGHGKGVYKLPQLVTKGLLGVTIKSVCCSMENTYCLSSEGQMFGCGSNYYGQLGIGDNVESVNIFTAIPITNRDAEEEKISKISCGDHHCLALSDDDKNIYSWGCGEYGRLGLGDEQDRYTATLVELPLKDSNIADIEAGPDCSFLILAESRRVLACGNNEHNKLGINALTPTGIMSTDECKAASYDIPFELKFRLVQALRRIPTFIIKCGSHHTALLDYWGNLFVFGGNKYGQLGLGDTKPRLGICRGPKIFRGKTIIRLACGDKFTIVATCENEIYSWGLSKGGRLGLEKLPDHQTLVLNPRPLFGSLWKCGDIRSCGWQTIMLAELVREANTISVDAGGTLMSYINDDNTDENVSTLGSKGVNDSGSETSSWLRKEMEEAEVIKYDEAHFMDDISQNIDCECGCLKCAERIKSLEEQLAILKSSRDEVQ